MTQDQRSKSKGKKKQGSVSKKRRGTAAKQQAIDIQAKRRVSSLTAVSQVFKSNSKQRKKRLEAALGGSRNETLMASLSGNKALEQASQALNYQLSFSK